jgi:hypothetical protein
MSFVLLERRTTMKADVGDRLVTEGSDGPRECLIIGLHRSDGAPPYVVRWRSDGHIALVYPGPYTRLVHSAKDFSAGDFSSGDFSSASFGSAQLSSASFGGAEEGDGAEGDWAAPLRENHDVS